MKVVIPCLDFGDYLAETLPEWTRLSGVDEVVVVTAERDDETRFIAERWHARVVLTDAWSANGAALNKAAALDDALARTCSPGELVACVDADVLPDDDLPDFALEPDVLYGCRRIDRDGNPEPVANLPLIERMGRGDSPESCGGYFQAFVYQPEVRAFGSHPTAAWYDYEFAFSFPAAVTLDGFRVVHLGDRRRHWSGRDRSEGVAA